MVISKSHLILSAIALIIILMVGVYALREHDARIRLEVANDIIDKQRVDAKAQLDTQVSKVKEEAAKVKTPSDAVTYLNRYIPFPIPLKLDTTPSTLPSTLSPSSPPPASSPLNLVIPPQDIITLTGTVERCNICTLNLDAAKADNLKLQQELDNAKVEIKGGNWIRRLFKQTKVIACAGLGAAAGSPGKAKGAAIGAVAGAVACSLF